MRRDSTAKLLSPKLGSAAPATTRAARLKTIDEALSLVTGKSAKLEYRQPPEEVDYTLKENRYDFKYVPPGGVNVVSALASMKYNLSKEKLKLQGMFTRRLQDALLEPNAHERALKGTRYHCKGCSGLLFTEKDRVFHAPVYMSAYDPLGGDVRNIRIMQGDTSNVALFGQSGQIHSQEHVVLDLPERDELDEDEEGQEARDIDKSNFIMH